METTVAEWGKVLDHLEDDLAAALTALNNPSVRPRVALWVPPDNVGPLPEEFLGQAENIRKAQAEVLQLLAAQRKELGKKISTTKATGNRGNRPVYLDTTG
ncbi:MAG: hypothetical protein HIU81_10775 [Acidobacteria bacterium]|nr:hypothetical protein [Acidobacteriota bacterium]